MKPRVSQSAGVLVILCLLIAGCVSTSTSEIDEATALAIAKITYVQNTSVSLVEIEQFNHEIVEYGGEWDVSFFRGSHAIPGTSLITVDKNTGQSEFFLGE